jgi:MSHA biogenesis protein MshE
VEDIVETAAKRRLGDIVVERQLVTQEQLDEALAEQRTTGRKLGEVLVDLGFITRVALAGVISEQWDDLRVSSRAQAPAETPARQSAASGSSVVEVALRERLEALTAAVAARDARIAQQDATITALLARVTQLEPPAQR